MSDPLLSKILTCSAAGAVVAGCLFFAGSTNAQPDYYDTKVSDPYALNEAGYDTNAVEENDVVVMPEYSTITRERLNGPVDKISTSRIVHFGDLDLASDYDRQILRDRVEQAAASVCNQLDREVGGVAVDDRDTCYDNAVRQAMHRVNARYDGYGY